MTEEEKLWIDNASVYDLLYKNRFEPTAEDGYFTGERGTYHLNMLAKRREEDHDAYVAASKQMGW